MSGVIVVDAESFRSTCFGRDAYIHDHCLGILITMLNSVNCSIVICSPTVEYLCSWEKPLVKPMAPGSILIISISITLILLCFFTLPLLFTFHLYTKNTKNIISIRSHSRKWPSRDWQPLIALVASSYRFVQVRGTWAWPPSRLIPWFSKTKGNTYATLLHHPFLFEENQPKLKT